MPFVLKFLAPEVLASAVIGKGGAVIAQMRASHGAKIALTDHNELYPGTDCRVITAQAPSEEAILEVATQIAGKVAGCVQETLEKGGVLDSLGGPEPTELRFRSLMPRAAVGGLIGKGGAAIKLLRESSGAKIAIGDALGTGPGAEQVVTISGTLEAIEYCLSEVNRQVQALSAEPWFLDWAVNPGVGLVMRANPGGPAAHDARTPPWVVQVTGPGGSKGSRDGGKGYGGDRRGPPPGPPAEAAYRHPPTGGLDLLMQIASGLPQYVMEDERGFALTCTVPNRLVGGLIGRGGSGTKEIQGATGAQVSIREVEGDAESRSLNITGPLANTCAAYMLMMKRYLDAEASDAMPAAPRDDAVFGKGGGKKGKR